MSSFDEDFQFNFSEAPAPKPSAPTQKTGGARRLADSNNNNKKLLTSKPITQAAYKPAANGKSVPFPKAGGKDASPHRRGPDGRGGAAPPRPAKPMSYPTAVLPKSVPRNQRLKQKPGKDRFKRSAGGLAADPDDPDELLRAAEPAEEVEDDLKAAMALMAAREQQLQQEEEERRGASGGGKQRGARAPAAELEGVVEFFDDDRDDGGGGAAAAGGFRKRRRLNASSAGADGAAPAIKATGRGNFAPGTMTHAAANAAAISNGDGDGGSAAGAGWTSLGLAGSLVQQLESLNFVAPTPIQRAVLPVLLEGRDTLVRAQTGSGKTLCYLLPVINDLQSRQPRISRSEGTHALVLAPTRELCIQVADVAAALLRRYHWLVSGLLIGGENRAHEKARLRRGVTLLAATPGRLLDHLQSTAAFKTSDLRWLVLDEADRLLDLGFEAKLRQITELLNQRAAGGSPGEGGPPQSKSAAGGGEDEAEAEEAGEEDGEGSGRKQQCGGSGGGGDGGEVGGDGGEVGGDGALERRQTVLVSATLHKQLGVLAELALRDPAVVGFEVQQTAAGPKLLATSIPGTTGAAAPAAAAADDPLSAYSLPSTLRQTWIEVPAKERLMALAALLRSRTARRRVGGTKIVVFVSSCDGVEFHHHLMGDLWEPVAGTALLPSSVRLYKLHGDMPQAQRTETFAGFSKEGDGVLLCTDVAARGLDFPNVTTIIQYDVPGAPSEYVHRVGRSARMGAAGEAVLVLMPHEVPYVNLLRSRGVMLEQEELDKLARWLPTPPIDGGGGGGGKKAAKGGGAAIGGGGGAAAARQLAQQFHRQVAMSVSRDPHAAQLAHDAYRSYVRAYATHSGDIKRVFAVRNLHLGHVAHAFCLLETPSTLGQSGSAVDRKRRKREALVAQEQQRKKKMRVAAKRVTG